MAKILGDKSRDELLDLLIDLSGRIPDVRQHIVETEQLTDEPAWYSRWSGEGSLPDFSHVEQQLRALSDRGHADAVLQLGVEL